MEFYLLLLIIAVLYASVGHGGASGYLALMALYGFAPEQMKSSALVLNLAVSLVAFWGYYKQKYFVQSIFIPIAMLSIPAALIGGFVPVEIVVYKKILGVLLLIPATLFLFNLPYGQAVKQAVPAKSNLYLMGAVIGLLSGMLGIGGGILLSPLLLLLNYADQRQTAAISALFIFVNSSAGLIGPIVQQVTFDPNLAFYVLLTVAGGYLGAYLGVHIFHKQTLKRVLSAVLFLAAFKLLFAYA